MGTRPRCRTWGIGRWALPLALAYGLLLQSVLGAAAGVTHALRPLPSSLSELCTPGDPSDPTPAHMALCCVLGCGAAGAGPLLVPTAPVWSAARLFAIAALALAPTVSPAVLSIPRPFDARGPPVQARLS